MNSLVKTAATIWRDYSTDGVPSSGNHEPKKSEIRRWGTWVETVISAYSSGAGSIAKATKALLDADLAHAADVTAWVYDDDTVGNNGIYVKVGASGSGSWTRILDLPFSVIFAEDAGTGTANAIQATSAIPVSESALIVVTGLALDTTSEPVTITFNGGTALTIKTTQGTDASALTAGMFLTGIISGTSFRLLTDEDVSALVSQAETARDEAVAAAATLSGALEGVVRVDEEQSFDLTQWRQGRSNIKAGPDTFIVSAADFGAVADCTDEGVGTDVMPAILAAWNYAVETYGDGATVVLPAGRYRASTAITLDMQGCRYVSLDMLGSITPDATAMTCMTFQNGYDLFVKGAALQGGIFKGWLEEDGVTFAQLPFGVDYSLVEDVVEAGGQEFIKIQGVFGAEVQLQATNYAGRLLRTTERADDDHPRTAAIRGSVETGFDEKTDIARCAQSIFADAGTTEGPGNWGSLDRLICDFDTYGPVWRGLNDIEIIAVDAAFGATGMEFRGCQAVHGISWYVGDISSIQNADHVSFVDSALGRQCAFINIAVRCLNAGHGVYLNNVLNSRVSLEYIAPSSSLPLLYGVRAVDCVNSRIEVSAYGYTTSLIAVTGSATNGLVISPRCTGTTLAADAVAIGSDVTGTVLIKNPYLSDAPAGHALIKVEGTALVNVSGGVLKSSSGHVFNAVMSGNNLVVSGTTITISGTAALNQGYGPRAVQRYGAESYAWGGLRSNSGGNSSGAGGSLAFGIAAGAYTLYSEMAKISGYLENAPGSELQGGITFSTRPNGTSGQALTDRLRLTSAGVLQFLTLPGSYASDTAAATGGVPVGGIYRNSSTGALTYRVS